MRCGGGGDGGAPSIEEGRGAVRPDRLVDQGMAAAGADHGAVDRASGARRRWAAPAAALGGRRWNQRGGDRRARAIAGTIGRRPGPQATTSAPLLPPPLAARLV